MNYSKLANWTGRQLNIKKRLKNVAITYLLFLMVSFRKHSLQDAARFSNSSKSRFSKLLKNHPDLAITSLAELSKRQAKQFGKTLIFLENGELPWKTAIIIDATIQHRSSLHTENAKKFNHGKGFVIGHQWTNIVLFINGVLIPLPPIMFFTKKYCRENNLKYRTEHEHVVEYIDNLNLKDYIGSHNPKEVVVLGDSGYDDKNIETAIARKGWKFIIALKKKRSIKTEKEYASTPKSKEWTQIEVFFKRHRWIKWITVCLPKNSTEKKRKEFRMRQITGYLRSVGKAQLICSEFKRGPKVRKKYLASNDLEAKSLHILMGYRIRWEIEIFHKKIKMFLGFEDVASKSFKSVISHVHWVYCAFILLNFHLPGMPKQIKSIAEKQRYIKEMIRRKELSRIRQVLSQFNGAQRLKDELQQALSMPLCC